MGNLMCAGHCCSSQYRAHIEVGSEIAEKQSSQQRAPGQCSRVVAVPAAAPVGRDLLCNQRASPGPGVRCGSLEFWGALATGMGGGLLLEKCDLCGPQSRAPL
jgi:hypothetical protein